MMKKLVLTVASVLTLAGAYVFFSAPCCSSSESCEATVCCPDEENCCHKATTASLDLK